MIDPTEHLRLVKDCVKKFVFDSDIEDTDEYADGVLALLLACQEYSFEKHKTKFSTFAVNCIKNAIVDKWRRQKCQKRNGDVISLETEIAAAPEIQHCDQYEFLLKCFDDHEDDTSIDRRNKKVLFDHYINGISWKEIGERMTSYGHDRPVTRAFAQQCGHAAIRLLRERYSDFSLT